MANLFDASNYPGQEPETLVVGDRWVWQRPDLVTDYPTDAYALTYEFHCDSGGGGSHKFTVTASETSTAYVVEVSSSTTSGYTAHQYKWYAFITRTSDSQRVAVDNGITTLVVNYADSNADVRTHAKKVLDSIQAVIENRATVDQSSFTIAGRSLSRMTIDELFLVRDRYRAEYNEEVKKARIRNKKPSGNLIGVRF
tara:strand:- start:1962 stop:2552 length:591 start_codon:yes stop_codon:yes gene_type:complete